MLPSLNYDSCFHSRPRASVFHMCPLWSKSWAASATHLTPVRTEPLKSAHSLALSAPLPSDLDICNAFPLLTELRDLLAESRTSPSIPFRTYPMADMLTSEPRMARSVCSSLSLCLALCTSQNCSPVPYPLAGVAGGVVVMASCCNLSLGAV